MCIKATKNIMIQGDFFLIVKTSYLKRISNLYNCYFGKCLDTANSYHENFILTL